MRLGNAGALMADSSGPTSPALSVARPPLSWSWHYAALVLVSVLVGVLYVHEPGFGDEITYWALAFDLHEIGRSGWSVASFHDLRWPVWGISWLWQGLFGTGGLPSFYAGPIFYLAAGAAVAFSFGRLLLRTAWGGWLCAGAYLAAPLLDTVIYRPAPDISENVFTGCAVLAWWAMMTTNSPRRAWLAGTAAGLMIGIGYSNRVTGVFIAPVLALMTLTFFPRRWKWLLVPAAVSALFFLTECAVYQYVCGDWLHSLHANLGAGSAKDVEVTPIWKLPFRFVNVLFHGNRLAPACSILAIIGTWAAWRKQGVPGRVLVVWFYAMYLIYSCSVQSLHPVLPLIGSTARYMSALALPHSLLAALGLAQVWSLIRWKFPRVEARLHPRRALVYAALVVFIALFSSRPFFDLGFTKDLAGYMNKLPDGTKIFTHHLMHDTAFLADVKAARRFAWTDRRQILVSRPDLEAEAAACDEFWYLRKQVWLVERKKAERHQTLDQPKLGSYLETPERDWKLREVLSKGDGTDVVMFSRRRPNDPPPHILTAQSPELAPLVPALPLEWNANANQKLFWAKWPIPESLRGKLLSVHIEAASANVEPLNVRFVFVAKQGRRSEIVLKPIFYRTGGFDFFAIKIPPNAERSDIEFKFTKGATKVQLTGLRAVYDDAP